MKVTIVTFVYEGSDSDDRSGLTRTEFDRVNEAISSIGGYDIEFEVEEILDLSNAKNAKKKK